MADLRSVISRVRKRQADDSHWLYMAGAASDLVLETEADLGIPAIAEDTLEEIEPTGFAERGLRSTIDVQTLEDCIAWAERLANSANAAALDVIRYYIRFDAFPTTFNAPDPPSPDEVLRRLDREFCDQLGPEDSARRCRRDGCTRGALERGGGCRRHHFENVKRRAYPFDD